ncbi:uncharacterized protein LOC123655108 [Melitaea cinxia]|uniref:uncharacterized protein LOC123655108 n=1 Tax=Melitaea cinxia TaxID=113334 RepID=UPI001E26F0B9|nr:uncharacterized protein LOC123655108 [Melitaea cinxia]
MDRNIIECAGFYFIHSFDSGNLGHVERVPTEFMTPTINTKTNTPETPDYEFNLWTRPDCAGTEFENGNRTWFYFGIQASEPNVQVRLNLINLNKQGKMYNQGMAPVTRTLPGKPQWERIKDRPVHSTDDNTFTLSFRYRTAENPKATTFFAFTYPYSFAELQIALNSIDLKMLPLPPPQSPDDIYYCRECLIYSLEGRRVDLLTISSHHGITSEREDRLKNLFPENQDRPFKFQNKKVVFVSARVHPGETPSSFVFNGFLNLLLTRNDPVAIQLRKLYVFKLIPFLNPDGVARGHYRTDTRGVNLNRVYLNPSLIYHPTVYASRSLIRYYHFGYEKEDDICEESKSFTSRSVPNISESSELIETKKKKMVNSPSYKGDTLKRDKSKTSNKSSMFKQVSDGGKELSGDTGNLVGQVYDMKLQEMPSQASATSPCSNTSNTNLDSSSLLNEAVLQSCLGSDVRLAPSDQLDVYGTNPLKPLRETLKNSISLLMESNSSVNEREIEEREDKKNVHNVVLQLGQLRFEVIVTVNELGYHVPLRRAAARAAWCGECRRAAARLERSEPGLARRLPGYGAAVRAPRRCLVAASPLLPHRSTLTAPPSPPHPHRSTLTAPRSPLHPRCPTLAAPHSPLHAHRSTLAAPPSPLHTHRSTLTAPPSLPHPHRSTLTAPPSLPHPRRSTLTAPPSPLHTHRSTLTAPPSPPHPHRSTLTAPRSPLHPRCPTLTAPHSPLHAHRSTLAAPPSPLHTHRSTLTAPPSPPHPHRSTLTAPRSPLHPRCPTLTAPRSPLHPRCPTLAAPHSPLHPRRSTLTAPRSPLHPRRPTLAAPHSPLHPRRPTLAAPHSPLHAQAPPSMPHSRRSTLKLHPRRASPLHSSFSELSTPRSPPDTIEDHTTMSPDSPTYHTIDEYREHQRQQIDDHERKLHDAECVDSSESIYFCTNCFKRYIISEGNEEINLPENAAQANTGDHYSPGHSPARSPAHSPDHSPAGSTGDTLLPPIQAASPKEDKLKSIPKIVRRKPAPPVPPVPPTVNTPARPYKDPDSGLFLYIDLHGHASKKGIFMYGNHFEDLESCVECMLLPRIMSLNNLHFHFSSCNFTERNMYLKDRRDGMSREGSGRVAVLKATGLVRSYTLECNYNTGRLVNALPPAPDQPAPRPPPKYTPAIFRELCLRQVGRSLGASILDLTGQHPHSRIPSSEHRNLAAVRDWLRAHTRAARPQLTSSRLRPKTSSPTRMPLFARSKAKVTDERKENAFVAAKSDAERKRSPPVLAPRSGHELANNTKFAKKNEPVKSSSRTRYLADSEPRPKTLASKRRNVLAIRKPGKTQGRVVKAKASRREDGPAPRPAPRAFPRLRARRRAASDDDEPRHRAPDPDRLKKIRLKAA